MGVPAFYRWLSEKYPKIVQDVLEERVQLAGDGSTRLPVDATRPNPSGLETDNLYIDMNGIIHPCSHPEHGPQPTCEEEMYENVCRYVDRLVSVVRPRKLLYLAIDGVAPRAKMNQQRSRRFKSAQEARERLELEEHVREELIKAGQSIPPLQSQWDSNVITPGTLFMIHLADYVRFYIRKRISESKAWKAITVLFSDASIPGEGEHKIMEHVRLQRCQPGYNPNTVHVLHGLDADLIMLALATHEMHFYILREQVTFGRKSIEVTEQRQLESGFQDQQRLLDEQAGDMAMSLPENQHKPLERISIPILREYLASEFASLLQPGRLPFGPSLERLIDDVVFLCFFVGNDFLPHLPSLDIRDGALDFLFNVYKRVLPTFGDYITNHGGQVNLSHVDVILAEVGAIEDYVFQMKHSNEEREKERREQHKQRQKQGHKADAPPVVVDSSQPPKPAIGRAAKIMEKASQRNNNESNVVALGKAMKQEESRKEVRASHMETKANVEAALALKRSLTIKTEAIQVKVPVKSETNDMEKEIEVKATDVKREDGIEETIVEEEGGKLGRKRKLDEVESEPTEELATEGVDGTGFVDVEEAEFEEDDAEDEDADEEDVDEIPEELEEVDLPVAEVDPAVAKAFKEKVQAAHGKKLDDFTKNVDDSVRLHESGWKERYYKDKCKAEDVSAHGGREHMYRSYVTGLCWVMKYYYSGCPSWKWYYPFHYAPFASDLRNIERFKKDCNSFELNEPFKPVEQLMAVLPEDSAHALPKVSQWLMSDAESPIIDFYPKDVPVDPNGKAMPWLWVVLLPFIDEERLLAALTPTLKKWTTQELLCNARGLDNGYVYLHTSNRLMDKLSVVLKDSKKYSVTKMRLADSSSYGAIGFFGSVRLPLSNEIHPVDEDVKIEPPSSSWKITKVDFGSIFADPVDPNAAVCFAFTEPPKLSHKSVVLPGAKPPRPVLRPEDRRLRRPRLNRGGATIANMGGTNSHQSGHGSMNISSYERDLANRTGRGNQMHQAGTRAWGAMEPAPKRWGQSDAHPTYPSNPFSQTHSQGPPQNSRPPWQNPNYATPQVFQNQWQAPPYTQGGYQQQQHRQGGPYLPQQQAYGQPGNEYQQPIQPRAGAYPQGAPPPRGQPHSFQSYNRSAPPGQQGYARHQPQHQSQPPSRVNENVMNDLRSQLAGTLNRNRQSGQQGGNRR